MYLIPTRVDGVKKNAPLRIGVSYLKGLGLRD
jgi:hypothetical protein